MDLLSVFRRKTPATPTPDAADAVQLARTRARQRLIGAAVLVVAGIIGFPLLFETQPRPIPVDLPIEIPRKDNLPPLPLPSAAPPARVITETEAEAGREVAPAASAAASAVAAEPPPRAVKPPPVPPVPRASAPAAAVASGADGARAKALLEGQPDAAPVVSAAAASVGRFVVQIGAFAEPAALKEARAKVEKLGLKTYTQVAETPAGPRTRVRVGPFETRDEAERAAAKIKAGAMPAVILSL